MDIYNAIFNRRSVRKFKMEPVEGGLLVMLRKFIASAALLDKECNTEFEIYEHWNRKERIKGLWKVDAPYYLVVYCGDGHAAARNAGYMAEQIVLYMTAKGLGSCYLGDTRAGSAKKDDLDRILVIGFGYPDEPLYRNCDETHRLPLNRLCVYKEEPATGVKKILEAARMAPSSLNSQPWRFVVYSDRIYVFAKKELLPRPAAFLKMRDFDMGIVLSHILLAAEELWINQELTTEEQFLKKAYKNGEYICTINFKNA